MNTAFLNRHAKKLFTAIGLSILGLICLQSQPGLADTASSTPADAVQATVGADWTGTTLVLNIAQPSVIPDRTLTLHVNGEVAEALNKLAPKKDDVIIFQLAQPIPTDHTKAVIKTVVSVSRPVAGLQRLIALAVSFAVLLAIAAVVTGWKPNSLLIGVDNRYSNSQTQVVLWFTALITVYLATLALRVMFLGWNYLGNVGITANLLSLSGLSAFTFGTARVITSSKVQAAATQAAAGQNVPQKTTGAPHLTDLVHNDNQETDVGDFQMLFIAVIAVVIFALASYHFLETVQITQSITLPDVDTTLLSLFGIGQGAYLVKKAGSAPGVG
jgi:hypothetical protein